MVPILTMMQIKDQPRSLAEKSPTIHNEQAGSEMQPICDKFSSETIQSEKVIVDADQMRQLLNQQKMKNEELKQDKLALEKQLSAALEQVDRSKPNKDVYDKKQYPSFVSMNSEGMIGSMPTMPTMIDPTSSTQIHSLDKQPKHQSILRHQFMELQKENTKFRQRNLDLSKQVSDLRGKLYESQKNIRQQDTSNLLGSQTSIKYHFEPAARARAHSAESAQMGESINMESPTLVDRVLSLIEQMSTAPQQTPEAITVTKLIKEHCLLHRDTPQLRGKLNDQKWLGILEYLERLKSPPQQRTNYMTVQTHRSPSFRQEAQIVIKHSLQKIHRIDPIVLPPSITELVELFSRLESQLFNSFFQENTLNQQITVLSRLLDIKWQQISQFHPISYQTTTTLIPVMIETVPPKFSMETVESQPQQFSHSSKDSDNLLYELSVTRKQLENELTRVNRYERDNAGLLSSNNRLQKEVYDLQQLSIKMKEESFGLQHQSQRWRQQTEELRHLQDQYNLLLMGSQSDQFKLRELQSRFEMDRSAYKSEMLASQSRIHAQQQIIDQLKQSIESQKFDPRARQFTENMANQYVESYRAEVSSLRQKLEDQQFQCKQLHLKEIERLNGTVQLLQGRINQFQLHAADQSKQPSSNLTHRLDTSLRSIQEKDLKIISLEVKISNLTHLLTQRDTDIASYQAKIRELTNHRYSQINEIQALRQTNVQLRSKGGPHAQGAVDSKFSSDNQTRLLDSLSQQLSDWKRKCQMLEDQIRSEQSSHEHQEVSEHTASFERESRQEPVTQMANKPHFEEQEDPSETARKTLKRDQSGDIEGELHVVVEQLTRTQRDAQRWKSQFDNLQQRFEEEDKQGKQLMNLLNEQRKFETDELTKQLNERLSEITSLRQEIEDLKKKESQITQTMKTQINQEVKSFEAHLSKLKMHITMLEGEKATLVQDHNQEVEDLRKQLKLSENDETADQIWKLQASIAIMEKENQRLSKMHAQELEDLQRQKYESQKLESAAEIESYQFQISKMQTKIQRLEQEKVDLQAQHQDYERQLESELDRGKQQNQDLQSHSSRIGQLQQNVLRLQHEMDKLIKEHSKQIQDMTSHSEHQLEAQQKEFLHSNAQNTHLITKLKGQLQILEKEKIGLMNQQRNIADDHKQELDSLMEQLTFGQQTMKQLEDQSKELVGQMQTKEEEYKVSLNSLMATIESLEKQITSNNQDQEVKCQTLQQMIEDIQSGKDELEWKITQLREFLDTSNDKNQTLTAQITELEAKLAAQHQTIEEYKIRAIDFQTDWDQERQGYMYEIQNLNKKVKDEMQRMRTNEQELQNKIDYERTQLTLIKADRDKLEQELKKMEEIIATIRRENFESLKLINESVKVSEQHTKKSKEH